MMGDADYQHDEKLLEEVWLPVYQHPDEPNTVLVEQANGSLAPVTGDYVKRTEDAVYLIACENGYPQTLPRKTPVGELQYFLGPDGIIEHKKLEKKTMFDIDEAYDNMSAGDKQHMANRLYAYDGVYAQKLKHLQPLEFAVGDVVEGPTGRLGRVVDTEPHVYQVRWSDKDIDWESKDSLSPLRKLKD